MREDLIANGRRSSNYRTAVALQQSRLGAVGRWAKIKRPLIADDDAPKRPRRETPVKERATKVGLAVDGTPQGVRETVANPDASPRAVRYAQQHLHQHQKAVQSSVALAELRAAARIHRYVKFDNDTQDKN